MAAAVKVARMADWCVSAADAIVINLEVIRGNS
jgi:hypothetical protein